jgi:hypothetical protein
VIGCAARGGRCVAGEPREYESAFLTLANQKQAERIADLEGEHAQGSEPATL